MNSTHLRGRVAVFSGAEREIATALAREGMSLCLIGQSGREVRELADELTEKWGIRCFPAAIDITDDAAVARVVMHVEQQLGAVDLLVNNADESTVLTQALLPTMRQRGRGHIVNVKDGVEGRAAAGPGVVILTVPALDAEVIIDAATGYHDRGRTHA